MRFLFYVSRLKLKIDNAFGEHFCVRNSHEHTAHTTTSAPLTLNPKTTYIFTANILIICLHRECEPLSLGLTTKLNVFFSLLFPFCCNAKIKNNHKWQRSINRSTAQHTQTHFNEMRHFKVRRCVRARLSARLCENVCVRACCNWRHNCIFDALIKCTMWQCPHLFFSLPSAVTHCLCVESPKSVGSGMWYKVELHNRIGFNQLGNFFRWCNGLHLSDRCSEQKTLEEINLIESSTFFFLSKKWENILIGNEWAMTVFWLRFNWDNFTSLSLSLNTKGQ